MAEYLIQDTTLTSIADAIREKTGTTGVIKPTEMASKIRSISVNNNGSLDNEILKYFIISYEDFGIVIHKICYDKIYAKTGSYDVEIPDTIGGFPVYINASGVI